MDLYYLFVDMCIYLGTEVIKFGYRLHTSSIQAPYKLHTSFVLKLVSENDWIISMYAQIFLCM